MIDSVRIENWKVRLKKLKMEGILKNESTFIIDNKGNKFSFSLNTQEDIAKLETTIVGYEKAADFMKGKKLFK